MGKASECALKQHFQFLFQMIDYLRGNCRKLNFSRVVMLFGFHIIRIYANRSLAHHKILSL